jgi:hypothetical protein
MWLHAYTPTSTTTDHISYLMPYARASFKWLLPHPEVHGTRAIFEPNKKSSKRLTYNLTNQLVYFFNDT